MTFKCEYCKKSYLNLKSLENHRDYCQEGTGETKKFFKFESLSDISNFLDNKKDSKHAPEIYKKLNIKFPAKEKCEALEKDTLSLGNFFETYKSTVLEESHDYSSGQAKLLKYNDSSENSSKSGQDHDSKLNFPTKRKFEALGKDPLSLDFEENYEKQYISGQAKKLKYHDSFQISSENSFILNQDLDSSVEIVEQDFQNGTANEAPRILKFVEEKTPSDGIIYNRKFPCKFCGIKFSKKSNVRKHERRFVQKMSSVFSDLTPENQILTKLLDSPEKFKAYCCSDVLYHEMKLYSTKDKFFGLFLAQNLSEENYNKAGNILNLKEKSNASDENIQELRGGCHAYDEDTLNLNEENHAYSEDVLNLNEENQAKDVNIRELNEESHDEDGTIPEFIEESHDKERTIPELNEERHDKNRTIPELNEESHDKNRNIPELNEESCNKERTIPESKEENKARNIPKLIKIGRADRNIPKLNEKNTPKVIEIVHAKDGIPTLIEELNAKDKNTSCTFCGLKFSSEIDCKNHEQIFIGKVKADLPELETADQVKIVVKAVPENFKDYSCTVFNIQESFTHFCGIVIDKKKNLKGTRSRQTSPKKYFCILCCQKFEKKKDIQDHVLKFIRAVKHIFPNFSEEKIVSSIIKTPEKYKDFLCLNFNEMNKENKPRGNASKSCDTDVQIEPSLSQCENTSNEMGTDNDIEPSGGQCENIFIDLNKENLLIEDKSKSCDEDIQIQPSKGQYESDQCPLCGRKFSRKVHATAHIKLSLKRIKKLFPDLKKDKDVITAVKKTPEKFMNLACMHDSIYQELIQTNGLSSSKHWSSEVFPHLSGLKRKSNLSCILCKKRLSDIGNARRHVRKQIKNVKENFPHIKTDQDAIIAVKKDPKKYQKFLCSAVLPKECKFLQRKNPQISLKNPNSRQESFREKQYQNSTSGKEHFSTDFLEVQEGEIPAKKVESQNYQSSKSDPHISEDKKTSIVIHEFDIKNEISELRNEDFSCILCGETFQDVSKAYIHEDWHHSSIKDENPGYVIEPLIMQNRTQEIIKRSIA